LIAKVLTFPHSLIRKLYSFPLSLTRRGAGERFIEEHLRRNINPCH
jgi:hypothetical protein